MNASKLPNGKWRARAYNKYTKSTKSFTASSKKQAERQAQLYAMQVCEETMSRYTLRDAIDVYIMSHRNIWKSERTAKDYEGYKTHYKDLLDRPLDMLTDQVLQEWVNEQAKKFSPKYIKNMFSLICTLKKTYSDCRVIKVAKPKVIKPQLNLPAESDVMRYLAYVEQVQDDAEHKGLMTVPAYLAALCAMRRGEIAALTLRDVNFDEGCINIRQSLAEGNNGYYLKPPKNGHPRTIYPPAIVLDKIKKYGIPKLNLSQLSKRQAMVVKDIGASFGLHSLRHYCAARLLSIGCPIADVQEYGGWTDTKILLEIYNYVINESRKQTQIKWDNYANDLSQKIEKLAIDLPQSKEKKKKPCKSRLSVS